MAIILNINYYHICCFLVLLESSLFKALFLMTAVLVPTNKNIKYQILSSG